VDVGSVDHGEWMWEVWLNVKNGEWMWEVWLNVKNGEKVFELCPSNLPPPNFFTIKKLPNNQKTTKIDRRQPSKTVVKW